MVLGERNIKRRFSTAPANCATDLSLWQSGEKTLKPTASRQCQDNKGHVENVIISSSICGPSLILSQNGPTGKKVLPVPALTKSHGDVWHFCLFALLSLCEVGGKWQDPVFWIKFTLTPSVLTTRPISGTVGCIFLTVVSPIFCFSVQHPQQQQHHPHPAVQLQPHAQAADIVSIVPNTHTLQHTCTWIY